MVPFVKVMLVAPVVAVNTAEGPQFAETVAGAELLMVTPVGRLSTSEKFVSVWSGGAVMVMVRRVFCPCSMIGGLKLFAAPTPVPAV